MQKTTKDIETGNPFVDGIVEKVEEMYSDRDTRPVFAVFVPSNIFVDKVYKHFGVRNYDQLFPQGLPLEYVEAIIYDQMDDTTIIDGKLNFTKPGQAPKLFDKGRIEGLPITLIDSVTYHALKIYYVNGFISTERANEAIRRNAQ